MTLQVPKTLFMWSIYAQGWYKQSFWAAGLATWFAFADFLMEVSRFFLCQKKTQYPDLRIRSLTGLVGIAHTE